MNKTLENKIDEITDEWWQSDNRSSFVRYAEKLISKGFTEDEAVDFLRDCYDTVASEYGD